MAWQVCASVIAWALLPFADRHSASWWSYTYVVHDDRLFAVCRVSTIEKSRAVGQQHSRFVPCCWWSSWQSTVRDNPQLLDLTAETFMCREVSMADSTNCEFLSMQDYKPKTIPHRPYGQGFLLQVSTFVLAIISVVLNFTNMNQVHHRSIDGSPDSWSFNGGQCSSTELFCWILLNKIEKPRYICDVERNQKCPPMFYGGHFTHVQYFVG